MPNWCTNDLTLTGLPHLLDAVVAQTTNETLDFAQVRPPPPALLEAHLGLNEMNADALRGTLETGQPDQTGLTVLRRYLTYPWVADLGLCTPEAVLAHLKAEYARARPGDTLLALAQRRQHLRAEHGAADLYTWRCQHWGTKGGAVDSQMERLAPGHLRLRFETAACPPAVS
ncbi:hypothetical protein [Deinococcus multiflagellatus]|uniref:Uncharacterized protein n=1 Tax=Deinococcus multiflagellatus TaxID=1656887 RepID=A0ABW1ZPX2_9DEIO